MSVGSERRCLQRKSLSQGFYVGGKVVMSVFYYYYNMIYIGGLEFWHLLDQLVLLWPFHGYPPPSLSCGFVIATKMVIFFAACMANSMAAFVVPINSKKISVTPVYVIQHGIFLEISPLRLHIWINSSYYSSMPSKFEPICNTSRSLQFPSCRVGLSKINSRSTPSLRTTLLPKRVNYRFVHITHSLGLTKNVLYQCADLLCDGSRLT